MSLFGQPFGGSFALDYSAPEPAATDELRMTAFFLEVALSVAAVVTPPATDPTGGGTVGAGTDPAAGLSLCPVAVPLAWLEIRPAGSSTVYRYAKVPINLDGFPKDARVESFGRIERALSNDAGDFRGVNVTTVLIDKDRVLRGLEDSDSLIGARVAYYISSEVAIRAGSTARRVFDGIITDTEPLGGLLFQIQAADYFGALMQEFAAHVTIPRRVFTVDDFPYLANPAPSIGYDGTDERPGNPDVIGKPIPIGYGLLSDEALGADAQGVVPTTFVGQRYLDGYWWDEYVVFGHAVGPDGILSTFGGMPLTDLWGGWFRTKSTEDTYGVDIVAPGHFYWATLTGSANLYREYNGNRYTVIFARGPRSWAASTKRVPWTVNCGGVEDVGDGTGTMIDGLHRQILHLLVNFVFGNYTSGAWLSPPVVPGDLYSRIQTASFEAVQTLSELYVAGGFAGAFILGTDGTALTLPEILRTAAVSAGFDYGINKEGQLVASMVDPSRTLNRAIVDITDTITESFRARRRRDLLKNTVKYRYGKHYVPPVTTPTPAEGAPLPGSTTITSSAEWETEATPLTDATSIAKYGARELDLELAFVRDQATADAVAGLALATLKDGPTLVAFTERLCGTSTDLGDRDTLTHFEGITATGYTARSLRCESHTLDLDEISKEDSAGDVEKEYRDLVPIDFSALEIGP